MIIGWDVFCVVFLAVDLADDHEGGRTEDPEARRPGGRDPHECGVRAARRDPTSLAAVAIPLSMAGTENSGTKVALIAVATVTVVLSWLVLNTVFTLRYADLYFRSQSAVIDFGSRTNRPTRTSPTSAFTIGMTYQVSDTTLRNRRCVAPCSGHALLSYLFGVVIVAAAINLIAGLVR